MSLAVWIGGTCTEIDELRQRAGGGFWDRLLDQSGYSSVAVDIMAGASAGGLNGVVYAASQVYGFPMASLKGLWVELGDTSELLRTSPAAGGWPSLFMGDAYFYMRVEEKLRFLVGTNTPPVDPPPVALKLSATLVEPIRRPGRSPSDERLTHLRFASGFAFDNPRYSWLASDFPPSPETAGVQPWSSKLALAARSTSSFPAAFEAAVITSTRPSAFGATPGVLGAGLQVDMGGVFLERGARGNGAHPFLVSDGGIVDNIPLGRALDAIAHAAADLPTDRYLIYVQPGAPAADLAEARDADPDSLLRRRSTANVLKGLLGARLREEDIIGDLQQLDDYNTRIQRAISMRRSTFTGIDGPDDLLAAAGQSWNRYRQLRAGEDERLVSTLLDDPVGTLGEDPFPSHVGGQPVRNSRWRSPLDDPGSATPSRERLAVLLTDEFANRLDTAFPTSGPDSPTPEPAVVHVGALPLLRICQLLIEWAQYRESFDPEASAQKARLYRVATFVREAIERPRRLAWVTLAATLPQGLGEDELVGRAAVLSRLVKVPALNGDEICAALLEDDRAVLGEAVQERLAVLDNVPLLAPPDGAGPGDGSIDLRVAILNGPLVAIAQALRDGTWGEEPTAAPPPVGWYLDRVMPDIVTSTHLEALEVVAYPEFATGLPGRRPINFRRLSSANPTPLAPRFGALLNAAEAAGTWWDPENSVHAVQEGIHVDLKLAGNEMRNFSAFLNDSWRANDWFWGRMDAVPTLVELLVTPELLASVPDDPAERANWLEALVLGSPEPGSSMRTFLAQQVLNEPTRTEVLDELEAGGPPVNLRRTLIAARQWEIIAHELGADDLPEDPVAMTEQLLSIVEQYAVGAESIRSEGVRDEVAGRFRSIGEVASRVALYNAQLEPSLGFLGTPDKPSVYGRTLQRLLQLGGRRAAKRATGT